VSETSWRKRGSIEAPVLIAPSNLVEGLAPAGSPGGVAYVRSRRRYSKTRIRGSFVHSVFSRFVWVLLQGEIVAPAQLESPPETYDQQSRGAEIITMS